MINNISVSLSLYCLVLFYIATEERLKPFSPFYKFVCVKSIVFLAYYQYILFQLLVKLHFFSSKQDADFFLNLLLLPELIIASYAQSFAFPFSDYALTPSKFTRNSKRKDSALFSTLKQSKVGSESLSQPNQAMYKTIGQVLYPKEVIRDTKESFGRIPFSSENQDYQVDPEDDSQVDRELQMNVIKEQVFNWSDEDNQTSAQSQQAKTKKA